MTIATHVCRSNFRGTWFSSGGYDPVTPYLFQLNYDGFFLEYDTDRAGGDSHWQRLPSITTPSSSASSPLKTGSWRTRIQ